MPKQWPLVIEQVPWEDGSRRFSRGHHSDESFVEAAIADGMYDPERPHPPVVREYWRFVPSRYGEFDLEIVPTDKPGRGAVPITAEDVP